MGHSRTSSHGGCKGGNFAVCAIVMGFHVVIVRSKSAALSLRLLDVLQLPMVILKYGMPDTSHRIYWELVWKIREDQVLDEPHQIGSLTSERSMSTKTDVCSCIF